MAKFKLDSKAVEQLLRSQQVQDVVGQVGARVAARAGAGFGSQTNVGTRARATVMTETRDAKRRQSRDHVLEAAVGGGVGA